MGIKTCLFSALLAAAGATAVSADSAVPVAVAVARSSEIRTEINLNGSLVARRVTRASTELDGLIAHIHVDDGDWVAAGTVIVELEHRLAEIARDAAAARADEARARHAEAVRRHTELATLEKQQHAATSAVATAAAQIDIEAALLAQSAAELEHAREILARHVVRAPYAALVERKLVEQGEWVEANTPLVELLDVDVLRLEVPVPQGYFAELKAGTPVEIRFDAYPDRRFSASVTRIIPVNDPASRTFRARIDLPNSSGELAPGMSARVNLRLGAESQPDALTVPRDAVVRDAAGTTSVWTVREEDGVYRAHPVPITVGRSQRDAVEILAGQIAAGAVVVVRGNELLRPGQSVHITPVRTERGS